MDSEPANRVDFDWIRRTALALPGVKEVQLHGAPSLKVSGRLLACPALHQSAEPNSIVVAIDLDLRTGVLETDPQAYYLTDHYRRHPVVLVRLEHVDKDSMKDLLAKAWRFLGSKVKTTQ